MPDGRRWRWALVLGGVAVTAVLAWLGSRDDAGLVVAKGAPVVPHVANPGWSLLALGGGASDVLASTPLARADRSPEEVLHALFKDGSLRGSELDGGWGRWDGKWLLPDAALRRRFDQLLSTVGETSANELRQVVAWLAERDLGNQGAQAVLEVWERYLALQRYEFREAMDLTQPERWARVLQERQAVRRQLLGVGWADVFYAEEEDALRQRLDRSLESANAAAPLPAWTDPPPTGTAPQAWHDQRVASLGQEAADRLLAAEREQADWESRLAAARLAVARLAAAPELSTIQREAAIRQWMDAQFHGSERLRVGALLGL